MTVSRHPATRSKRDFAIKTDLSNEYLPSKFEINFSTFYTIGINNINRGVRYYKQANDGFQTRATNISTNDVATHEKWSRDPTLSRDPWFENRWSIYSLAVPRISV